MRQASTPLSGSSDTPRSPRLQRGRLQAGAPQQVEREALARHDPRLDAARRPANVTDGVGPLAQQLPRDGNPGKQMPARAAAGDQRRAAASCIGTATWPS